MESLVDVRRDHPRRPLIFVAYSLGGIIVKSAIVLASGVLEEERQSASRGVVRSTAGFVFLGTPHRIHSQLDKSSGPGALQKIVQLSGRYANLLNHLDDECRVLQNLLEPFEALSTDKDLVSFFESRGLKDFGLVSL